VKQGAEQERRGRRRLQLGRLFGIGGWSIVAFGLLFVTEGPFWRSAEHWLQLAVASASEGDWNGALANVQQAIEQVPEDPGLQILKGHALRELGEPARAAWSFRAAMASVPSDPEASLGLADALLSLGDSAEASQVLRRLALDPKDPNGAQIDL